MSSLEDCQPLFDGPESLFEEAQEQGLVKLKVKNGRRLIYIFDADGLCAFFNDVISITECEEEKDFAQGFLNQLEGFREREMQFAHFEQEQEITDEQISKLKEYGTVDQLIQAMDKNEI